MAATTKQTICDALVKAIRGASVYNPECQTAPVCILWPDRDRQWEAAIPLLQAKLPELLVLGRYTPEKRTGPAIWLRCVIAGKTDDCMIPDSHIPILYLPGISRQDLRAVESCPDHLKPLAELQYRGVIWSQINARDWTILAFLKSDQGGLGLDVAQDNDARNAMQLALYRLLDEDLDFIKGRRLDKDYFNTLLTGGDPVRDLLQWLDHGDAFQAGRDENEWKAFVEVCKSQLAFNPQAEGVLTGAVKLATREGPWRAVWERFCEAPQRYPHIPDQIRKCSPPSDTLFWHSKDGDYEGWPQWNQDQEKALSRDLKTLADAPSHEVRHKLIELEKQHGRRRTLVWAELGQAPMAKALEPLAVLAEVTKTGLASGTLDDLVDGYCNFGWKADEALARALAQVETPADLEAVSSVIRSIYQNWAEASARHLQSVWDVNRKWAKTDSAKADCVVFVDGLRLDCARRLSAMLAEKGLQVDEQIRWAALPSVTGTGKPAVAPLQTSSDKIKEEPEGYNFELMPAYQFRKAIEENGYFIAEKNSVDFPGPAMVPSLWCEIGDIDHEGHDRGWKLAKNLEGLLEEIRDRIMNLFAVGWKKIRVVTDHGWLLLPGGLPKSELSKDLTESKWGRCALLKSGASTKERLYPWYWNPNRQVVLADGISCFKKGEEYAHGGLSLQECLTLELTVEPGTSVHAAAAMEITDVVWKGLRCTIVVEGHFSGLSVDIRTRAGDASSSVIVSVKPLKESGSASVIVENEDLDGQDATVVLIDDNGAAIAQVATKIGGGK